MKARDFINQLLTCTRYRVEKVAPSFNHFADHKLQIDLEYIIAHRILKNKNFYFVQIGANDGVTDDPIYKLVSEHKLKGLLVEPLPDVFELLKKNYENNNLVKAVNLAVHPTAKNMSLYRIKEEEFLGKAASGKSSFSKEHLLKWKKKVDNLEELIIEEKVNCLHLMELLTQENINQVDLMQIDVEGFDFEVIKMIDFDKIKPSIIHYEHDHLSIDDTKSCLELLVKQGYKILSEKNDTIAYLV